MRHTLFFISLIAILSGGILGASSVVFAQESLQDDMPVMTEDERVGGTTVERDGFNWTWLLLPLLAIPLIFMLRRDPDTQTDVDRSRDRLVGAKGGEARRARYDDTA